MNFLVAQRLLACLLAAIICLISPQGWAADEKDPAAITIDVGTVINTLNPLLFGQNILLANGLWNSRTKSIDVGAAPLIEALSPSILRFPGGSVADIYAWEDGVGVKTATPVEQFTTDLALDEAPNWRGVRKARFLDSTNSQFGDVFSFLQLQGSHMEGVFGLTGSRPAGATVRPEPRTGQPDWLSNSYGILEHMQVARTLGANVIITVNYGTGLDRSGAISTTASLSQKTKRAAAFVAFCNGNPSDKLALGSDEEGNDWKTVGYWAQKRKNVGFPEPFGITLWEVGNEIYHANEVGYTNAKRYGTDFIAFSRAMKSVDPGIKVGAVGMCSPHDRGDADQVDQWDPTLLRIAKNEIDFLVFHPYYPAATSKQTVYTGRDWFTAMSAAAEQALADLGATRSMIDSISQGEKAIPLAITEYGIWPVDSKENCDFSNIARTAFDMDLLAGFLRDGGTLGISLVNAWNLHGSNPTALIRYDWKLGTRLLRPQYFAFQLARHSLQNKIVDTKVSCPTFSTPKVGNVVSRSGIPLLNAVGTLSDDGKVLCVMVINRSLSSPVECSIRIPGFTPRAITVNTLAGQGPGTSNEINSETIAPRSRQLDAMPQTFAFPPHSITFLECRAEKRASK